MLRGPPGVATPGAFLFWGSLVNRTVFLVDGFNLYQSVLDGERVLGRSMRWLDVSSLCSSYLHALPGKSVLKGVVHFSALPHHLEARRPGVVRRQMRYLEALRATGVETRLGQFKRRERTCPVCGRRFVTFEEKETDVAIGTTLTRLVCDDACDTVVLVTGDTDLVPAVISGRDRDPGKTLAVLFPYRRANAELKRVVDASFTIKATTYAKHQVPRGSSQTRDRWNGSPASTPGCRGWLPPTTSGAPPLRNVHREWPSSLWSSRRPRRRLAPARRRAASLSGESV